MSDNKFNPEKLQKLNNPARLKDIPPDTIWNKLNLTNPKVLIDIGSGTGLFSIEFNRFMNDGKIYACDISKTMIDWMKNNVCADNPGIEPVLMTENTVPLKDSMADLVFMITLHHELLDPIALLTESYRLLKPNGNIFIVDWKKIKTDRGPKMEIRYLPESISTQLESVGFQKINIYNNLQNHFLITAIK